MLKAILEKLSIAGTVMTPYFLFEISLVFESVSHLA